MNIPLFYMILNIKNFTESKLSFLLNLFNLKLGKNFLVILESHEKYYKYSNEEKCLIYIFSKKYASLKNILAKYNNILWKYTSTGNASFEKDGVFCVFKDEDAYWNYEDQEEFFLDPDITWVNFIAFPIDPKIAEIKDWD